MKRRQTGVVIPLTFAAAALVSSAVGCKDSNAITALQRRHRRTASLGRGLELGHRRQVSGIPPDADRQARWRTSRSKAPT